MEKKSFFDRLFGKKANSCCCGSYKIVKKESQESGCCCQSKKGKNEGQAPENNLPSTVKDKQ